MKDQDVKTNGKVAKSIIYNTIGAGIFLFCQWLMTFVVVWISGYGIAGILSLAMSISNTFNVIATFNMRNFQSSDITGEYSEKTYLYTRIFTCIIALILTIIYSLTKDISIYELLCIVFYMIYKISESFVDMIQGSIQKKWRFDVIGISFIVRGLLTIGIFSIGLLITKDLLFTIIIMAAAMYIFIFLYDIRKYKSIVNLDGKFYIKKMFALLINCLPLVIYGLCINYIAMIPKVYVETNLGNELLGYYSSVATPALMIQVASSFIFTPLLPLLTEYYNNRDYKKFSTSVFKVLGYIFVFGIMVYILGYFFGDFGLKLIYGEGILNYSYLFTNVIIVSTLTALVWFLNMLLTIMRKYFSIILGGVVALIVAIIITPNFINTYSLSGINYILIITYLIITFIYLLGIFIGIRKMKRTEYDVVYIRSTSIINDSRASKEITTLCNEGYKVLVLGWDRDSRITDYNNVSINGNNINCDFFKYKTPYGGSIKTIFGLLFFQIWLLKKLNQYNFKIIHACDFDCGYVSYLYAKSSKAKLVYDMYDYYSDSREMPKMMSDCVMKAENRVINFADVSIICGEWREKQISLTKPKELVVIHNSPSIDNVRKNKLLKSNSKKKKIVYVGILQENRLILEIVKELANNKNYELHIGGFGPLEAEINKIAENSNNIYYYGSMNYEDVLALEKDCDYLFAIYNPIIRNHKYSAPNKVYEAMALGKPIVVCKDTGIDDFVVKNKIGFAVKYDAKDFVAKLDEINSNTKIQKQIHDNGIKLYKQKYSWNIMEQKLSKLYDKLLQK